MSDNSQVPQFSFATGEALAKVNTAAAKGFQKLAQYFLESGRQSFENIVEVNKRLVGVKTLTELGDLQAKLAQKSFEIAMERGRALSELTNEIATDVTASFNAAAVTTSNAMRKAGTAKAG
jgi:phasin family protein